MTDARRPERHDGDGGVRIPPPFSISAQPAPPGVLALRLEGEADMSVAERFRERVEQGLEAGARSVVLDMAEVGFMDSTMLRELLRAQGAVAERGGVAMLAGVQPPVRRLLDLTRTTELFGVADSAETALREAASGAAPEAE